jgi:hypothetical protein
MTLRVLTKGGFLPVLEDVVPLSPPKGHICKKYEVGLHFSSKRIILSTSADDLLF